MCNELVMYAVLTFMQFQSLIKKQGNIQESDRET